MRFNPEIISFRKHVLANLQTKGLVLGTFTRFYCLFNFFNDLAIGTISFTNTTEYLWILQLY